MVRKDVRGNPAGRKSRATTPRVRLMRELAEMIVMDPAVQAKLFEQARAGTLNPRLMLELFHYHAGKPPERVEVPTPDTGRDEIVDEIGDALSLLNADDQIVYADLCAKVIAAAESRQEARGPRNLTA